MSPRLLPILSCCLAAACATGFQVDQAKTATLPVLVQFDNPKPELVEVQFYRGFMVVQPGPVLDCQLLVDLTCDSVDELRELAGKIRPEVDEAPDGSRTVIRLGLPSGNRLDAVQTRYLLRVPADTRLRVQTRKGSVYLRDFAGDVKVQGGEGVIEADLLGGVAELSTESGSISLRGDYTAATVVSDSGRVRACLPADPPVPVRLEVECRGGETSVDIPDGRAFQLKYRGDENLLRPESEIEFDWIEVGSEDGEEYLVGRVGPPTTDYDGELVVRNGKGLVRIRRLPIARP